MQQEQNVERRVPKKRKPLILKLSHKQGNMDVLELVDATKTFEGLERPILDNQAWSVRVLALESLVETAKERQPCSKSSIKVKLNSGKIDVSPGTVIGYFHKIAPHWISSSIQSNKFRSCD